MQLLLTNIRGNLQLHLETLRIFTFLASGNEQHSARLIANLALPFMIDSLSHPENAIVLEATWGIANLLGDSDRHRIELIAHGIIPIFLRILESSLKVDNRERTSSIVWALSNICRGKPLQSYAVCRPILLAFGRNYAFLAD